MKANEFIKEYGLDCAKQELIVMQEAQLGNNHQYYIDDLKRLIKAHDLVEKMGGLDKAKQILSKAPTNAESYQDGYYFRTRPEFLFHNGFHHWNMTENDGQWFKDRGFYPNSIVDLKQAITDVESCL